MEERSKDKRNLVDVSMDLENHIIFSGLLFFRFFFFLFFRMTCNY